jgi:hypothetical protein
MLKRFIYLVLILCGTLFICPSFAQESGVKQSIDDKADKLLRQMSDYLNKVEQFTLHTENSIDSYLSSGQALQLGRAVDVFVRRPDRFRANIKGDIFDQILFYDGKSITLFGKKVGLYATLKAPSNIEAAMDYAEQSFGLVAPLADIMYRNCYDILMEDVQSGFYAGLSTIMGVECHHLAFRGEETDWQIWIENSKTPLPRKFVITSKWVAGAPQFTGLLTKWDVTTQLNDTLFTFVAPKGAHKIDFLPTENQ